MSRIKVKTDDESLLDAVFQWLTPEQLKAYLPPTVHLFGHDIHPKELVTTQEQEFLDYKKNVYQDESSSFFLQSFAQCSSIQSWKPFHARCINAAQLILWSRTLRFYFRPSVTLLIDPSAISPSSTAKSRSIASLNRLLRIDRRLHIA